MFGGINRQVHHGEKEALLEGADMLVEILPRPRRSQIVSTSRLWHPDIGKRTRSRSPESMAQKFTFEVGVETRAVPAHGKGDAQVAHR